jgi:hypothetical protein
MHVRYWIWLLECLAIYIVCTVMRLFALLFWKVENILRNMFYSNNTVDLSSEMTYPNSFIIARFKFMIGLFVHTFLWKIMIKWDPEYLHFPVHPMQLVILTDESLSQDHMVSRVTHVIYCHCSAFVMCLRLCIFKVIFDNHCSIFIFFF